MTKKEYRKIYLKMRMEMSDAEQKNASAKIIESLIEAVDLRNKKISLYLPIKAKKEIDTWILINQQNLLNSTIALPVSDFNSNTLKHIALESSEQLATNQYGIQEPTNGIELNEQEFDLVIVPLLAFDKQGFRVGYGKGFYDRFLSKCSPKCLFIGLSFFEACDAIDDINEFDIPLHLCITPNQIYHFNRT